MNANMVRFGGYIGSAVSLKYQAGEGLQHNHETVVSKGVVVMFSMVMAC